MKILLLVLGHQQQRHGEEHKERRGVARGKRVGEVQVYAVDQRYLACNLILAKVARWARHVERELKHLDGNKCHKLR